MENKYSTDYSGMEYIIYDKPIRMNKKDAWTTYKEGGILFYECEEASDIISIMAHIKYKKGWSPYRYKHYYERNGHFSKVIHCHSELLKPVYKTLIETSHPKIMQEEKFYGDEREEIECILKTCMSIYDVSREDMKLLIQTDTDNGGVVYWGYTFENYMTDEEEELGLAVENLSYNDYCYKCESFKKQKEKDENKEYFDSVVKEALKKEKVRPKISYKIERWIAKTPFLDFCSAITKRVKGQEATEIVVANVYNYLKCVAKGKSHNNNMFLVAPSGCGKTETFRAIRDYFEVHIPELVIYQIDMTSITQEGFKGKDTQYMIEPLKSEDEGIGIAFLDEFDKKLVPSYESGGGNVNLPVQSQILTVIEGRKEIGKNKIYTGNTLFIAMGAFDACRKKKAVVEKHVGFGQNNQGGEKHYAYITREDMISLGACYELIGRFSTVINYHELDEGTVDEIIDGMVAHVSNGFDCMVRISEKMRKILHNNANSQYGCRIIESIIRENAMLEYLNILKENQNPEDYEIIIEDVEKTKRKRIGTVSIVESSEEDDEMLEKEVS